jgi:hypothetical protein
LSEASVLVEPMSAGTRPKSAGAGPARLAPGEWPSSANAEPHPTRPDEGEPAGDQPAPADRPPSDLDPETATGQRAGEDEAVPEAGKRDVAESPHDRAGPGDVDEPAENMTAELVAEDDRIAVSLAGAAGSGPAAAFGWRGTGQTPPTGTLPVLIGEDGGRKLFLDLGRCPDVLTIVGPLPDCEKYALRLARQLLADGNGVAVLGERILADALPAGGRRVEAMADVRGLDSPGIVICGRLTGADLAAARVARSAGGPTPVVIGDVPRSRWSLVLSRNG